MQVIVLQDSSLFHLSVWLWYSPSSIHPFKLKPSTIHSKLPSLLTQLEPNGQKDSLLHSSMSMQSIFDFCLWKPFLQTHSKEPNVFLHIVFLPQVKLSCEHSLTSRNIFDYFDIKIMKNQIFYTFFAKRPIKSILAFTNIQSDTWTSISTVFFTYCWI